MKIQSNLFDRFVRFASRNLTEESDQGKVDLRVGRVIDTEQGEFMVMEMSWNTAKPHLRVVLDKVVDGKVEYK